MKDTLVIGSSPYEENCAQLGTEGYYEKAQLECRQLIVALRRLHGPEPEGARFRIKGNAHDYGTYYEVVIDFDDREEKAVRYAYKVEAKVPARWTEEDLAVLQPVRPQASL